MASSILERLISTLLGTRRTKPLVDDGARVQPPVRERAEPSAPAPPVEASPSSPSSPIARRPRFVVPGPAQHLPSWIEGADVSARTSRHSIRS